MTPWITAHQTSLSITNSWSSLKLMSIESVMPSSHLILCHPLLLLPPIPPSIRVFSNKSTLHMRWPKYWSFSFSIIPFKEISGLISFRMDWLDFYGLLSLISWMFICFHCYLAKKFFWDFFEWGSTSCMLLIKNVWIFLIFYYYYLLIFFYLYQILYSIISQSFKLF